MGVASAQSNKKHNFPRRSRDSWKKDPDLPVGWSSKEREGAVRKIKKIKTWSMINILCVIFCFRYNVTPSILTLNISQGI